MGLLDEAIREHLDLKRRRGADPAEVERAEREALGPVRRNRDQATVSDPDAEAAVAESAHDEPGEPMDVDDAGGPTPDAYDHEQETDGAPAHGQDDEWTHDDDRTRVIPPPTERAVPPLELADDDEPFAEDEPLAEDVPPEAASAAPHVGRHGGETTEYIVEDALAAEGGDQEDEDEDMLEETPEFLQDTPDHDRLWFEQRPPRDFDFDG